MLSFSLLKLDVHFFCRPQVFGLIVEKAFTKVSAEYLDFVNIFSLYLGSKLTRYIGINNHAIELVDNQQPFYEPIYNLKLVELKTLKAYIETNLVNGFIRPPKSLANILILFDRKSDNSLQLFVNYWGLNNLTIKN